MKTSIKNFLFGSAQTNSSIFHWCYLFFRIYAGFSIAKGAGLAKVFHKINEKGPDTFDNLQFGAPDWFMQQVSDIGFTFISPAFWTYLAVYGEFIGGILIALGIFTRLSSLQLAFQFFVVSFIWYNEPAPMIGMYYQQLIFWSFVMTFGAGDGHYSLATWLKNRKGFSGVLKPAITTLLLITFSTFAKAQQDPNRISFTVKNPTLKNMSIEFKSYNYEHRKTAGYGYSLNALASHATNLPVPARIYATKNGKRDLILVVHKDDEGKTFDLNKKYEISHEDWLKASFDELNEKTNSLEKAADNKSIEQIAQEKGIKMVTFRVKGASFFSSQTHVRYQLPWDKEPSQTGFSKPMRMGSEEQLSLPVGTKLYVCSDKYWDKSVKYTEKLIVTVDEEKANYLFKL